MLGLTEQVGSHVGRSCIVISHDEQLARPCHHVDTHNPVEHSLGRSNKCITRSHDLVDLGNRLRTECQCTDRLHSAYTVNVGYTSDVCRHKEIGIDLALLGRSRHDDPLNTGDLSWNCTHQDS